MLFLENRSKLVMVWLRNQDCLRTAVHRELRLSLWPVQLS